MPLVAPAVAFAMAVIIRQSDLVDQGEVQVLLRVEVLVEHGFGDAGDLGHVVHRGAVVAVAGEDLDRHIEDLLAAFAGGKSGAHNGYPRVTGEGSGPDAGPRFPVNGSFTGRRSGRSEAFGGQRPRSRSSRSAAFTA